MRRRLTLARETLAPLTNDDLAAVAGADALTPGCPTYFPLRNCLTFLTCDPTCHTEA